VVESVKTASDIYSPVSGKVTAVNDALSTQPELVNTDPYGQGWIFQVEAESGSESTDLLSAGDYRTQIGG
jgi:glycine cleavage system H protein